LANVPQYVWQHTVYTFCIRYIPHVSVSVVAPTNGSVIGQPTLTLSCAFPYESADGLIKNEI